MRKLILTAALLVTSHFVSSNANAENPVDSWLNTSAELYAKTLDTKAQLACTFTIPKLTDAGGGVAWNPTETACKGNSAIITTGKFSKFFSWVARDALGRDRITANGHDDRCAVNSCSVAKVQRKISRSRNGRNERVWCLGTPGTSKVGKTFRRITGKRPAVTRDPAKDIVRYCIKPTQAVNLN
jgi:hypothetical protein